ncbi:conserved hypothetical protein [Vibrio crassostreae]|uniref:chromosome partitioning protein ParA n=1 Tax=Vibrio crassostreae TaxID=246167 RepID=UPI001B313E75|nr:chromosome partitioning protein ParA [Vibrio crassostreae]CAK1994914.1 conserved hypothetical protein [Vibrio crassostreae]CAK2919866.1 conserved hypothetical protein [Vibrio crassostreae]CAK3677471.1 conserved hypothetical protein [Vibrio crassostreae]
MQLNRSFVLEIKKAIDESSFCVEDFEFELPKNGALINITFIHHPEFTFHIREVEYENEIKKSKPIQNDMMALAFGKQKGDETEYITERGNEFEVTMSPGELRSIEQSREDHLGRISYDIKNWCGYIESEMLVIYSEDDICNEELSSQIDDMFPDEFLESNERFTTTELAILKQGLDGLFERISKIRAECDLSEEKLKILQSALKKAESNARVYPKGTWLKVNKGKITSSLKKLLSSPKVQELGFEVIKKLVLKEI